MYLLLIYQPVFSTISRYITRYPVHNFIDRYIADIRYLKHCLGSIIQKDGEINSEVNQRIQAGWLKQRSAIGVLCDRNIPLWLKEKFYQIHIRPALLYGTECWVIKRYHAQIMIVAEMRMFRWMCGNTRRDKVRNEDIRAKIGVAPIVKVHLEGGEQV